MKPWEETWQVERSSDGDFLVTTKDGVALEAFAPDELGRARLAARAPAMFRVLLDVLNGVRDDTAFVDASAILSVLRDAGLPPAVKQTAWVCSICGAPVKAAEEHYCGAGVIP